VKFPDVATLAVATEAAARRLQRTLTRQPDTLGGDARVDVVVSAPPPAVWAVLADGAAYADWVVGTAEVRTVDEDWPAEGAQLYYSAGVWPLLADGVTTVRECVPEERLVLEVQVWPAGSVRVVLTLEPVPGAPVSTRVHLDEHPWTGLVRALHTPLASAGFAARGTVVLAGLASEVEQRVGQ
jgi:uncharacterized protein YndB with AHSA1/START domain